MQAVPLVVARVQRVPARGMLRAGGARGSGGRAAAAPLRGTRGATVRDAPSAY